MPARKKATTKKTSSTAKKTKVSKKKSTPAKNTKKISVESDKSINSSMQPLILNPVLVINNAKSLIQDFSKLAATNKDIYIDASAVEMIDTAILQLLLAFTIKVKSTNNKINWINPSDKFISNASLLGLSKQLNLTSP